MVKMTLKTKTRKKEIKTFVGLKSVPLGMHRWGIVPVYKKDYVEKKVVCVNFYNLKAIINNILFSINSLTKKEAI